jgi:hypothetical protein
MIKASRFITTALLLVSLPAVAQHSSARSGFTFSIPNNPYLSAQQTVQVKKQLSNALRVAQVNQNGNKTAAGNERLNAMAEYNFAGGSGTQFADSFRFVYNNTTRTSVYDFFLLSYDIDNSSDLPVQFSGSSSANYVHYDTAHHYTGGSSTGSLVYATRTYNSAGKVTVADFPENLSRTYYEYDVNGRLVKATMLDGNGGTGMDSSSRDFYVYNSSGFLIKDSSETWDPTTNTWEPNVVSVFTNNAAGYPTRVDVQFSIFGIPMTVFQVNASYNTANLPVSSVFKILSAPFQPLENASRDTFSYSSNNMLVYHNSYEWDTLALNWRVSFEERRHLNSAQLPDSAWQKSYTSGVASDTTIIKLSYNANGNPTRQTTYAGDGTTREFESRYYYASTVGVAGSLVKRDISIYPNPVSSELRVNGLNAGRFSIVNAAGQMMVSGTLSTASCISLQGLANGVYQFVAVDATGGMHAASFVKQ